MFEFLADLAYIRYNYRHFNHSTLPGWARGDTLLAERVDTMLEIWHAIDAPESSPAQALFAACAEEFRDGTSDVDSSAGDGRGHEGSDVNSSAGRAHGHEGIAREASSARQEAVGPEADVGADNSQGDLPVCARRLKTIWADALADGLKPWESQRYKRHSYGQLRFCRRGGLMVFGNLRGAHVAGVAVLAGPATEGCSLEQGSELSTELPERLREPFREYLAPSTTFDFVRFDRVYDLRPRRLTWADFFAKIKAPKPGQWCGYPRLKACGAVGRVLALCRTTEGVIDRVFHDPYGDP